MTRNNSDFINRLSNQQTHEAPVQESPENQGKPKGDKKKKNYQELAEERTEPSMTHEGSDEGEHPSPENGDQAHRPQLNKV